MRNILKSGVAALLIAGAVTTPSAASAETKTEHVLVPYDQRMMEQQARRLLQTDVVKREISKSIEYLKTLPRGVLAEDLADLDAYVTDLAFCVALAVVNSDPARPRVLVNGFAGAQYGLVNPDNIYRFIPLSSTSRYQITGKLGQSEHVSFELTDHGPFTGGRLGPNFGTLTSETLQVAADGSFTITLGPDESDGRPNHFKLPQEATQLMVRDTLSDWAKAPMALRVDRLSGPATDAPSNGILAEQIAAGLDASAKLWLHIPQKHNYHIPPNTLPTPNATGAGGLQGQYITGGHYKLTEDQALVITVRKGTARYLGFQLGSNWYVPFNYASHSSSLNNHQAIPNPDGSYTYVIALRDPGVANWLDPIGHPTSLTLMRWQGVREPLTAEDAPVVRLVSFADLPNVLPLGTPMVTEAERHQQLQQRQSQVTRRRLDL